MSDMMVRELRHGDIEGVRRVDELTQRAYHGSSWDSLSEDEREGFLKSRRSEFGVNCGTGFSFVAVREGEVIGFLFAHENLPFGDEVVVRHIAVHPGFQDQGIGEALFSALIARAGSEGKGAIRSWMNPDNPASIRLHERCGFEVVDWKRATLRLRS
jgi:L-amino acid N-acyltransferase YncA